MLLFANFSQALLHSYSHILKTKPYSNNIFATIYLQYGLTQELSALCFLLLSVTYSLTSPIIGKCLDSFVSSLKSGHRHHIVNSVVI